MLDNSFVGLKEQVEQALKLKGIEYTEVKEGKGENKIGMIIFTDGGSRDYGGKRSAGFGVHGYIYLDKEVKSNSNAPSGYPSNTGYSTGILDKGQYKVDVLYYIDFYGACGDETNNYAELLAGLYALEMIKAVEPNSFTVFSDSKYFTENTQNHLERWSNTGWMTNQNPIANKELWEKIYDVYKVVSLNPKGKIQWVKGHDVNIGNGYADTNASSGVFMGFSPLEATRHVFNCLEPKEFWDRKHELSPLLSEKRIIMHTERPDNSINSYFQLSMGDYGPTKEWQRREAIGKRIADTCVSVVFLEQKDPVLDKIVDLARTSCGLNGIMVGRLDLLTMGDLYYRLATSDCSILYPKDGHLITPEKVELLSELTEARLSWRTVDQFEWLSYTLAQTIRFIHTAECDEKLSITNITSMVYDIEVNKKDVSVYTIKGENEDSTISCPVTMFEQETTVTLTMTVDLPSLTSLRRIAKFCPDVYLISWLDVELPDLIHYAVVIRIGQDFGIWTGAYASLHVLKRS